MSARVERPARRRPLHDLATADRWLAAAQALLTSHRTAPRIIAHGPVQEWRSPRRSPRPSGWPGVRMCRSRFPSDTASSTCTAPRFVEVSLLGRRRAQGTSLPRRRMPRRRAAGFEAIAVGRTGRTSASREHTLARLDDEVAERRQHQKLAVREEVRPTRSCRSSGRGNRAAPSGGSRRARSSGRSTAAERWCSSFGGR